MNASRGMTEAPGAEGAPGTAGAAAIKGVPDPDRVSAVALAMWVNDQASQSLGMELLEVRPGFARLRMPVRAEFLNGLGSCHGGYMFLLADSAFAFACTTTATSLPLACFSCRKASSSTICWSCVNA